MDTLKKTVWAQPVSLTLRNMNFVASSQSFTTAQLQKWIIQLSQLVAVTPEMSPGR